MFRRLLLLCLVLFLSLISCSPALAQTAYPTPSKPLSFVYLVCDDTVSGSLRVHYGYLDGDRDLFYAPQHGVEACDGYQEFLNGSNPTQLSPESAAWIQAGIGFLKQSIEIGAKIYPVILLIRVVSLIVYS